MQAHGIEEHFIYACECSLVCESGSAEEYGKEWAVGSVAFLVKAMALTQKTFFALVQRRTVERIVLHQVPNVHACDMGQTRFFLHP